MKAAYVVAFAATLAAVAPAQQIRITGGVADYQVLQRSGKTATAAVSGTAEKLDGKVVEARVLAAGKPLAAWTPVGPVNEGKWAGQLGSIPAGGPYTIEFRAAGAPAVAVKDLLVGDLWILAGQSNMEGVGDLVDVQPPDPKVHSFNQSDVWGIAAEPLHSLRDAVDRVHWAKNAGGIPERLQGDALQKYVHDRKKGAGPGLPFAVEMVRRTGVPVGLIPCAHGGTSMAQWDPALKTTGGDSLYGSMIRRFRAVGGHVAGVLWYQGEADANPTAAPVFEKKFESFVAAVRSDLGEPDLPFYWVQIGRHISKQNEAEWNRVQEDQLIAESKIPNSGMISAIDVDLDDGIHVSTQDQKRLGRRLALLATHTGKKGPRPASATYVNDGPNRGLVRVKFEETNGPLTSEGGRMNGFSIHDAAGAPIPSIYKTRVDADGSTVLLYTTGTLPPGAALWYGFGKDPYCNLHDSEDMGVPVFGPMPIEGVLTTENPMEKAVAILDGRRVTAAEMDKIIAGYPIYVKQTIPNDPQNFLLTHVFVQNALKAAHEEGIEDKAPYKFQFEQFLFNAYLNEQRNKTFISPAEQQQYYDAHKEKYKEPFEKVKDQVYTDMLDEAQRRKISELKAKATAKVLDPEYFKNYKPM